MTPTSHRCRPGEALPSFGRPSSPLESTPCAAPAVAADRQWTAVGWNTILALPSTAADADGLLVGCATILAGNTRRTDGQRQSTFDRQRVSDPLECGHRHVGDP